VNCKITPEQAAHIRHLVRSKHQKLREVKELYPQLSTTQIHRIASGTNWQSVTRPTPPPSNTEPQNAAPKR
jgi:hypothetical protein